MARSRKRPQGAPDVASAVGGSLAQQSSPELVVGDKTPPEPSVPATPASRPTPRVYSQAERERIHSDVCELMATGLSGRAACEAVGVPQSVWMGWIASSVVSLDQYARAREACATVLAESILDEAQKWALIDPAGGRLIVDAKKWVAARMYPKRWGDKLDITSGGEKVSPIVALPAVTLIPDKLEQAEEAEVLEVAELPRLPDAT